MTQQRAVTHWRTALVAVLAAAVLLGGLTGAGLPVTASSAGGDAPAAAGEAAPGAAGARTLILYDDSEPGELYAAQTANLVSHFGEWTAKPVAEYRAGELSDYDGAVYLGAAYDEPVPAAFFDDVLAGRAPVLWLGDNLWQLAEYAPDFTGRYGLRWQGFDSAKVAEVRYRDTSLARDPVNESQLAVLAVTDPQRAEPVATAVREDGSTLPWAVRSGELTYVSEIPYRYVGQGDRYLAFTDLLFDLLAPDTPERHRGLLRLEDVGPDADPAALRAIGDYLARARVPFSVAVYPVYVDPRGEHHGGEPVKLRLQDRPEVVDALRYLAERGGTLVLHGYTHQYSDVDNPYSGVSAADFEFYRAHLDEQHQVQLDGPVAQESAEWTWQRVDAAFREFDAAGLTRPVLFEFPHYAAGPPSYQVVAQRFEARYDRGMYYPGLLGGEEPDHGQRVNQFSPYLIRDVYGSVVVPENLGEVTLEGPDQHSATPPADLLEGAERNLVVRDGTASFFYHPFLGVDHLREMVEGLQQLGYEFVPAEELWQG